MSILRTVSAAMLVASFAGAAQADLTFSFADPINGRQVTHTANGIGGPNTGLLTYDKTATLSFLVDGSSEPNNFSALFTNARMEMNLVLGPAVSLGGGNFVAPLSGFFRIYDAANNNTDILRADATGGSFVRFSGTNSFLFSDLDGLSYTLGSPLQALLLPGRTILPPDIENGVPSQEGSFSLTDILTGGQPPASLVGANGKFANFQANASFSGNVKLIPTPGAAALIGLGGLVAIRRRRA
jgi:hypothetical protein